MSVQVIMKNGLPEWAVVPYQEYARLLEKARLLDQMQSMQPPAVAAEQQPAMVAATAAPAEVNPAADAQPSSALKGNTVAERIREARLQAGLDVALLARDAGISPSYLQMIEAGSRSASDAILHSLARSLKVPAAQLSGE